MLIKKQGSLKGSAMTAKKQNLWGAGIISPWVYYMSMGSVFVCATLRTTRLALPMQSLHPSGSHTCGCLVLYSSQGYRELAHISSTSHGRHLHIGLFGKNENFGSIQFQSWNGGVFMVSKLMYITTCKDLLSMLLPIMDLYTLGCQSRRRMESCGKLCVC